jgi:hypothetical protein
MTQATGHDAQGICAFGVGGVGLKPRVRVRVKRFFLVFYKK